MDDREFEQLPDAPKKSDHPPLCEPPSVPLDLTMPTESEMRRRFEAQRTRMEDSLIADEREAIIRERAAAEAEEEYERLQERDRLVVLPPPTDE